MDEQPDPAGPTEPGGVSGDPWGPAGVVGWGPVPLAMLGVPTVDRRVIELITVTDPTGRVPLLTPDQHGVLCGQVTRTYTRDGVFYACGWVYPEHRDLFDPDRQPRLWPSPALIPAAQMTHGDGLTHFTGSLGYVKMLPEPPPWPQLTDRPAGPVEPVVSEHQGTFTVTMLGVLRPRFEQWLATQQLTMGVVPGSDPDASGYIVVPTDEALADIVERRVPHRPRG